VAQFGGRGYRKFCIFIIPLVGIDTGSFESQTAPALKTLCAINADRPLNKNHHLDMRTISLTILFLWTLSTIGQIDKIKIKKERQLSRVTIAGLDTGLVLVNKILADKKLTITNNQDKIKIHSFDATINDDVHMAFFTSKSERLPKDLIVELQKTDKTKITTFKIFDIIALNSANDTIKLNNIELIILK
jgi:hypothetical protein